MSDLLSELQEHVCIITLNRVHKHNAFDDALLIALQALLDDAQKNEAVHVILLKANGRHFSAGADLAWMQKTAQYTERENVDDALIIARIMHSLYHSPKPTIAMVQGSAYGGGAGLVAACDIAIAADDARFCFSEVKLGLIPAAISPYVIKAIGERAALGLFMSAETIDAQRAYEMQLIQHRVPAKELLTFTLQYAHQIAQWPKLAVRAAKSLVRTVAGQPIDEHMSHATARLIAEKRVSEEGQRGLQTFLNQHQN